MAQATRYRQAPPSRRGKSSVQQLAPGLFRKLASWLGHHVRSCRFAFFQVFLEPWSGMFTVIVIGISMAVPAAFILVVENLRTAVSEWREAPTLSIFLKQGISEERARQLVGELNGIEGIARVDYISPQQALREYHQWLGVPGDASALARNNPLPSVLDVVPPIDLSPSAVRVLAKRLEKLPEAEIVQADIDWVLRLNSIIALAEQGFFIFGSILFVGMVLLVGNTIRLDILNRREEIVVVKLIGASDGFVRRPFIYGGLWLGLIGSFASIALLLVASVFIKSSLEYLLNLYGINEFNLKFFSLQELLIFVVIGALIGWMGAWISVHFRLRLIDPSSIRE